MDITELQKSTIAAWVKKGETIAIIQRRLREEMELSLTYMDVRFLVDDLNLVYLIIYLKWQYLLKDARCHYHF